LRALNGAQDDGVLESATLIDQSNPPDEEQPGGPDTRRIRL
jgi:hypothetical protein